VVELLDKEEHINRRWKEFFMKLLGGKKDNTEGEEGGDIGNENGQVTSRGEVAEEQITNEEIVEAIRSIGRRAYTKRLGTGHNSANTQERRQRGSQELQGSNTNWNTTQNI
ncbi:hypothetical protein HHI36_019027, partial [Cryptolaemus montrouzieri]